MAYIGAEPLPGQNREVDDISSGFNGNATAFTLQVNSVNVSPESANNILINLGGVLQNPGTDYTIAASTLTFTTAPAAGLSFFGLILGAGINTATVADDTIGPSKLIDTAVTAGSYTTADITIDAQGRITAAANGTISGAEIADQAVTNAKVNNSAAIAGTKISPAFGNQNITTSGTISSGNIGVAGTAPTISLTDINANDDFEIKVDGGLFEINDTTNSANRFKINSSGNIFLDTSTLTVDATNNRVGIGTTGPTCPLNVLGGSPGDGTVTLLELNHGGNDTNDAVKLNFARAGGSIGSISLEKVASNNTTDFIFNTRVSNSVSESVRITGAGNVGIGTTTPANVLDARGSAHAKVLVGTTGTAHATGLQISHAIGNAALQEWQLQTDASADGNLIVRNATTGTTTMFFDADNNNVGIGVLNPSQKLQVAGDVLIDGAAGGTLTLGGSSAHTSKLVIADNAGSGNGNLLVEGGDGTDFFQIGSNGELSIYKKINLGASGPASQIDATTTAGCLFLEADPGNNYGSSNIRFHVDNGEIMRIQRGTNPFVAIGRTTQQGTEGFTVDRNGQDVCFFTQNSSGTLVTLKLLNKRATASTEGEQISFLDANGTQRGKIINNTSTTTYVTSSDYRLKENQVEISDGFDRVKQLKPYKFNWKNRPGIIVDGFFAHEVENLVKDCVSGEKDRVVTQDDHGKGDYLDKKIGEPLYQMIDNSQIVPLLTAALKEAIAKIETLETKVAALEAA